MRQANRNLLLALAAGFGLSAAAHAQKAEVIHWWTSGGESAAIKEIANAYNASGGTWVDNAIAGPGENARSVAINRIVGGNPPTAAQFNTSKQFHDVEAEGLLNNIDPVAAQEGWDKWLPEPILNSIKIKGHFYAVPVNIHMPAWWWYSKPAFAKAGISGEPKNIDELFADLDKLKAAGIVPLAFGGQPWQERLTFDAILADVGGHDLYLKFYGARDPKVVDTSQFKNVLATLKRLHGYVDAGSPGRNWNDATSMVITGKAGVQIMGDWAKGEFAVAKQTAGNEFGCFPGFGPKAPYILAGDVFVFPKTTDAEQVKAQLKLAALMTSPAVQVAFNNKKGSIPIRTDVDASKMDLCAQIGITALKDASRQLPNPEMLVSPDVYGSVGDAITKFWNTDASIDDTAKALAAAIKG